MLLHLRKSYTFWIFLSFRKQLKYSKHFLQDTSIVLTYFINYITIPYEISSICQYLKNNKKVIFEKNEVI